MSHRKWHPYSNGQWDKPWSHRRLMKWVARDQEFDRQMDLEAARRADANQKVRERRAKLKAEQLAIAPSPTCPHPPKPL